MAILRIPIPRPPSRSYSGLGTQNMLTYHKPLIVVETGAPQNDQANYFEGIGQNVPTQFPDLKAILYFDAAGSNGDWALTQPGLTAFAQLLANPYFSFHQ